MKALNFALTIFIITLFSLSFTSAVYYVETSSQKTFQGYSDSMYLNPDFAPRADIFYTPFNAYRTYCAASYCPSTIKIVQIQENPISPPAPQIIVVKYTKPSYIENQPVILYKKPIAPIFPC